MYLWTIMLLLMQNQALELRLRYCQDSVIADWSDFITQPYGPPLSFQSDLLFFAFQNTHYHLTPLCSPLLQYKFLRSESVLFILYLLSWSACHCTGIQKPLNEWVTVHFWAQSLSICGDLFRVLLGIGLQNKPIPLHMFRYFI